MSKANSDMVVDRDTLAGRRRDVLEQLLGAVDALQNVVVLRAPPGSGKTYAVECAVAFARERGLRVAIGAQTNNQSDDLCRRLTARFPRLPVVRFASKDYDPGDLGRATVVRRSGDLPTDRSVVVGTTAKWACSDVAEPYDYLLVDEAWQLSWADLMLLHNVAPRFVFVGDPGQIAPVVTIDVRRWETSGRPPHMPAPEVILRDPNLDVPVLDLPVTTRLPYDTARLLQPFYDFPFDSWSSEGERRLEVRPVRRPDAVDRTLDLLATGSTAMLTLPTPDEGPPLEDDVDVARAAADVARRLVSRQARWYEEDGNGPLAPEEIGLAATHRVMVGRLEEALGDLAGRVRVDTPERWQGLERKVMIVVHPLSSVTRPSSFDLDTGRLCVVASRHRVGLVLVSRDHVQTTLENYLPRAEQPVGRQDLVGRGHARHLGLLRALRGQDRIVAG